jgi:hypothetical protein
MYCNSNSEYYTDSLHILYAARRIDIFVYQIGMLIHVYEDVHTILKIKKYRLRKSAMHDDDKYDDEDAYEK